MKKKILTELGHLKKLDAGELFNKTYNNLIDDIARYKKSGKLDESDIREFNHFFGNGVINSTLQGHSLRKPFGYAGDFLIIDNIYRKTIHKNPSYGKFDQFLQQHAAAKAVRNRKEYFKQLVSDKLMNNGSLDILDVASGPARDLSELYMDSKLEYPTKRISTTCIEMDGHAITYAKKLNKPFEKNITFIQKNICRYDTDEKYDLIWVAGLFDYFDDKAFNFLLKRFTKWVKPGGELAIGNFNAEYNPTRNYMEIFGEWFLNHRSTDHLTGLANQCGFKSSDIEIHNEPENVNLFMHLKLN